jgi:DNA-binding MarR family transcriptional regulator
MTNGKSGNEFKNIFNSRFTFAILSKIFNGYRPAKIAEQLHISPQRLNYHTDRLIEADLISKDNDEYNGITWRLTDKGLFILKQKLTWSVNNSNNNNRHTFRPRGALPVRLENICFAFKVIKPIPENLNLNWVNIKNGVAKSTIKYRDHTIELVKSNEVGNGSVILIHLKREYLFDWVQGLIQQYNLALHYCIKAA